MRLKIRYEDHHDNGKIKTAYIDADEQKYEALCTRIGKYTFGQNLTYMILKISKCGLKL